ncbi:MAG TPA: hypothetical protein VEX63_02460, partial [Flavisolibacter sp.]|nr:hypothetical protein [Flavisolibacter sp.]
MKIKLLISLLLITYSQMIHAQDIPVSSEQQLENLAEWLEMEIEDDHYLQQLNYLMKHPLALQRVNAEELRQLRWLTDLQIQQFINYREHVGPFISIYELQAIPAWDLVTIRKTIPFVTIEDRLMVAQNISNRFLSGDHTGLFRISSVVEKQKGFNKSEPGHYKGSKEKLLFRYKYQYKNLLQYGITGEKDP